MERRLAAILAADVVGYSRLMEVDEAGTLAALKSRRRDVLDPLVARHQGRIFKVAGDGVLVEFASAVNAVQCAVDLQHGMAATNGDQPEVRHIVLRIGVNLGDVMVEGSDLYGDGVNIAARLETMAEPGGILVSGTAYDHIKSKVKVGFDDLGAQTLKNIAEPVRAYRVTGTPVIAAPTTKVATDKPSIAVLPFTNMSGDVEQEYFSDGITEDIITELSRFRSLFVIARNSSFQYRDKAVDVRRVAQELGVQYVVEGSVRRMANRVRITAQLVDTASGNHMWSERYDRALDDIFAVQDEVVRTIVATLEGRVAATVAEHARRKPTGHLGAYECILRGIRHLRGYGPDDNKRAVELFQQAMDLDPSYALARAYRAFADVVMHGYADTPRSILANALSLARSAVEMSDDDGRCHWILGLIHAYGGNPRAAELHYQRAISLNPNDANALATSGIALAWLGRADEGITRIHEAMRLNPYHPDWYWADLGMALYAARRYSDAVEAFGRSAAQGPWSLSRIAACYAQMNRLEDAAAAIAEVLRQQPDFSVAKSRHGVWNPVEAEHVREGLRKAGLPE
jgi:TolB-like protein/Flp pilus assembly protein TadD